VPGASVYQEPPHSLRNGYPVCTPIPVGPSHDNIGNSLSRMPPENLVHRWLCIDFVLFRSLLAQATFAQAAPLASVVDLIRARPMSPMSRFLIAAVAAAATANAAPVDLGTAANYAILTKTGISTVPSSVITGDIGVSPAARASMTGFSFIADSTGASTSSQITGEAFASTDNSPTPSVLTTAVSDMETAYNNTMLRTNTEGWNHKGGLLGGETLTPGVYSFDTNIEIYSDITFSGGADEVFILQTNHSFNLAASTNVILSGGALSKNIFWQVQGAFTVGATAVMHGIILAKTNVAFLTGSSLTGRIFAQTQCALQMATITQPTARVLLLL
jgi:hypothetical protein